MEQTCQTTHLIISPERRTTSTDDNRSSKATKRKRKEIAIDKWEFEKKWAIGLREKEERTAISI